MTIAMKKLKLFAIFISVSVFILFVTVQNSFSQQNSGENTHTQVLGKWVRIGPNGPISIEIKENGKVETDIEINQTIDVVSELTLQNDTIIFADKEGQMCPGKGKYKMDITEYYVSFDLIDDECGGRIKSTMGFWTRPNFEKLLEKLVEQILTNPNPELYLNRARIFIATGKPQLAKSDLDVYISQNGENARAFINRAGTRFPADLEGAVADCTKAISLEPDNKNAYFLRGLANYESGKREEGCKDFSKAIELGFSVLRLAEYERCAEYWK
jgi:tetratricopeptide (TPR) repeat protein